MRIGINALPLQMPTTAAGLYVFNLIEWLDAYDKRNEYVVLSPRFQRAYPVRFPQIPSTRVRIVEVLTRVAKLGDTMEKLWWEQMGLVQAATREKVDLVHCPYFAAPVVRNLPAVVTIHDVIPLVLPEYRRREASPFYTNMVSFASKP
jgi:hypothetical protein